MHNGNIWSSQVNLFLSLLFVGSFTFGAGLILWHAYFGNNPIVDILTASLSTENKNY